MSADERDYCLATVFDPIFTRHFTGLVVHPVSIGDLIFS